MSVANPFQIPSCLQRAEQRRRQQERFQKIVTAIVVAGVSLMLALLIMGCINEQSRAGTAPQAAAEPVKTDMAAAPAPAPSVPLPLKSTTSSSPAPTPANVPMPAEPVYVVKPGDTLGQIARRLGTTTQALKDLNGLSSDRIIAGATLKRPTA